MLAAQPTPRIYFLIGHGHGRETVAGATTLFNLPESLPHPQRHARNARALIPTAQFYRTAECVPYADKKAARFSALARTCSKMNGYLR